MANDLCSPFNCNVCLIIKDHKHVDEVFYSAAEKFQNLLTCTGCQLVKYCNRQHQKVDWPIHRTFCKAVHKIKQDLNLSHPFYISGKPCSKEDVEKSIIQLKYLLKNILKRSLEYQEEELTSFPAYCPICFKFKNLKVVCLKCYGQAYCSEEHKEHDKGEHDKICDFLHIYYCPFKVQPIAENVCMEVQHMVESFHKTNLVEAFQKCFLTKISTKPCKNLRNYQLFSFAADFSCIMTVCYALSYLDIQILKSKPFIIFILGASIEAVLCFREIHSKLLLLQYPQFTELDLNFIGPEVVEPAYKEMHFSFMGLERLVKCHIYKGLFQDYRKHKIKPSLMIAFNCGFSEFSQFNNSPSSLTDLNTLRSLDSITTDINVKDTWLPGLIEIIQMFNTPMFFTSFTEQESQFDFAALQRANTQQGLRVHIERILEVSKNPFHDLRPLRQWYTRDREMFYYRNGYIQAIYTTIKQ